MASPVPANSQPLHNFPLPSLWSKNHPRPRRPSSKSSVPRLDPTLHKGPIPNSASPPTVAKPTAHNLHPPPPILRIKIREEREEEREGERGGETDEELAKVWNLRPRKATKKRSSGGGKSGAAEEKRVPDGEVKREKEKGKEKENKGKEKEMENKGKEKENKEMFSISLSRIEIEEDFFAMTGSKPPRRPRKRSKTVQKQLDDIFPGMWLALITPDSYKVNEAPEKP